MTGSADLTLLVARVPGGRRRLARDASRLAAWIAARYEVALELSVTVVEDARMAELNERYAGHEGPTDVLAFPLLEEPVLVGEVCVNADAARREAARREHSAYDELLLYVTHGVLHLVGHDDHDPARRRKMRRAEREALAALGVAPVFARGRRSAP